MTTGAAFSARISARPMRRKRASGSAVERKLLSSSVLFRHAQMCGRRATMAVESASQSHEERGHVTHLSRRASPDGGQARAVSTPRRPMKYLHTMLRISDIDQSLDFYVNKLGLKEVRRME